MQKEVKDKLIGSGMELVEVDNGAFKERCEKVIFNSLSPEMQIVYNDFQSTLVHQKSK